MMIHRLVLITSFLASNAVFAAPLLAPSGILQALMVGIGENQFKCSCPRMASVDTQEYVCSSSMDAFDSVCYQFYQSCKCDPVPILVKRGLPNCFISPFAGGGMLGLEDLAPVDPENISPRPPEELPVEEQVPDEEPPQVEEEQQQAEEEQQVEGAEGVIEPKEVGHEFKSFSADGEEQTFEITEIIKVPKEEADYFNVYKVKGSDGSEYILREATDPNKDMENEVEVLKLVNQFVASKPAPSPNVVVKIQPGITMLDMIARYLRDDAKLTEIFNGGLEALEALHAQNIYHGDPHTGNVLVTDDLGTFTFIDFGNSQHFEFIFGMDRLDERIYHERFVAAAEYHGRSVDIVYEDDAYIVRALT